jgi:Flp pilus assembly protein TadD
MSRVSETSGSTTPAAGPSRGWLWGILGAGALLRLGYLAELRRTPFFEPLLLDLAAYDAWARRIAAGEWVGGGVFYQDPLYPYLLGAVYALAGRRLLVVYLLEIGVGVAACGLVYAIGRRLFGPRAALAAAALAALYKPFIFYDVQLDKSFLSVFLATAAALLLIRALEERRPWLWAAAGALLGLASLVRGNYLLLAPLLALGILAAPRLAAEVGGPRTPARAALGALGWYGAGLAAVLSVTALHNYAVGGDLVLTTSQAGQNFFIGNNAANPSGMYRAPDFVRPDPRYEEADFKHEAERAAGRALRPSEVSRFWFERACRFIAAEPASFAAALGRKALLFWNDYEVPDNLDLYFFRRFSRVLRLWLPGFGLVAALAAWGMVAAAPGWRRLWPLYIFTAGYFLSVLLFYVFSRYRLPVVPFLMVFAGAGIRDLALRARARRPARLAAPAAVVAAMALVAGLELVDRYNPPALVNFGAMLLESGNLDDAEGIFRDVAARRPDFADAHNNLGVVLLRRGDVPAAARELQTAIRLKPRQASAHINLALALIRQGRLDQARAELDAAGALSVPSSELLAARAALRSAGGDRHGAATAYREAVALDPGSPGLRNNLGGALLADGDPTGALEAFREAARLAGVFPEAAFNEGVCLERLGRAADAIAAYRRALSARPDYAEAHANLAAALAAVGDREGAAAAYREFLRSWRGDPAMRAAVEEEIRKLR